LTGDRILDGDASALGIAPSDAQTRGAELRFERDPQGRTYVARQFAPYPFHFCRPFYLAHDPSGLATVYAQSCAGGVFEHDRLRLSIQVDSGAQCHVTTSAATIVHGMNDGHATQHVAIDAGQGALVEYLPDPAILFPESRFHSSLELRVDDGARAVVSDAFLAHDPAGAGRGFHWFRGDITIRGATGQVLARDRYRLESATATGNAGVMDRYAAQGGLFVVAPEADQQTLLARIRARVDACEGLYAGASSMPGGAGVVVRLLAVDGAALRTGMTRAWETIREMTTGRRPTPRRK
jgi:urease accessory protein